MLPTFLQRECLGSCMIEVNDLLGPLAKYSVGYFVLSFAITLVGVLSHYVKKCALEGFDWGQYWMVNKANSIASISAALTAYVTILMTDPSPSIITFLTIGYMTDSVLNKPGATRNVREPSGDQNY